MKNSNRDNRSSRARGGRKFRGTDPGKRRFDSRGDKRRFGDRDSGRPLTMHKAICSECGKECELPFKPTGNSLFFAVIVLGTRQIQIDLVEGIMKDLISKKNECTRQYVLSVEANVKCHFDRLVGNQFTVATALGRVTTLEARTLNSLMNSSKH